MTRRPRGDRTRTGSDRALQAALRRCRERTQFDFAELCSFLGDLFGWVAELEREYPELGLALCNVEEQAWNGDGAASDRFCQEPELGVDEVKAALADVSAALDAVPGEISVMGEVIAGLLPQMGDSPESGEH